MLNCLPRGCKFCPSLSICSCVVCVTSVGKLHPVITGGETLGLLRRIKVTRGQGGGVHALSKKVVQEIKVTRTVLGSPQVLMLSRPATNLSPGREVQFQGLIDRLSRSHLILLSARVISSIRCITGRVVLVGRKGFFCAKASSRVVLSVSVSM